MGSAHGSFYGNKRLYLANGQGRHGGPETDLKPKLSKIQSKMILQVHDELIFDVHISEKEIVKKIVKTKMENSHKTNIPLKVELGFGENWLQAH